MRGTQEVAHKEHRMHDTKEYITYKADCMHGTKDRLPAVYRRCLPFACMVGQARKSLGSKFLA